MATTAAAAGTIAIGGDMPVARMGYGAMRLTGQPGNWGPYPDPEGARAVLRRVVELGVTMVDTAHAYGSGFNEALIAQCLHPYPAGLSIGTKCGIVKTGPGFNYRDGTARNIRGICEASLRHLKVERLDLLQLHWVDPTTPIEESAMALDALRREGKVRHIGLCNITLEELERSLKVAPIATVQNAFNVADQSSGAIVDRCAQAGIVFFPYAPLGAKAFEREAPLVRAEGKLAEIAQRHGAKPGQVALAWLLQRSPVIVPIPGTTSIAHLEENVAAAGLRLSAEEMAELAG
jgi:aryl-alcohol dehydrogenase-like predicted oxidoreductase